MEIQQATLGVDTSVNAETWLTPGDSDPFFQEREISSRVDRPGNILELGGGITGLIPKTRDFQVLPVAKRAKDTV